MANAVVSGFPSGGFPPGGFQLGRWDKPMFRRPGVSPVGPGGVENMPTYDPQGNAHLLSSAPSISFPAQKDIIGVLPTKEMRNDPTYFPDAAGSGGNYPTPGMPGWEPWMGGGDSNNWPQTGTGSQGDSRLTQPPAGPEETPSPRYEAPLPTPEPFDISGAYYKALAGYAALRQTLADRLGLADPQLRGRLGEDLTGQARGGYEGLANIYKQALAKYQEFPERYLRATYDRYAGNVGEAAMPWEQYKTLIPAPTQAPAPELPGFTAVERPFSPYNPYAGMKPGAGMGTAPAAPPSTWQPPWLPGTPQTQTEQERQRKLAIQALIGR